MPSSIPIALQAARAGGVYLASRLLKIGPLPDDSYLRFTSIDKDEEYNDLSGDGVQTWYAATGVQLTTIEATNNLAVDNAEAQTLLPIFPMPGITEDMVIQGQLDTVEYIVYEHDCINGAAGEHAIMTSGILGKCRFEQGMVAIPELRSLTELLNQTGIISQTCLDCRTKRFGSQEGEEREWCGYVIEDSNFTEWVDFTVTAVGAEDIREFYSDDLPEGTYPPDDGQGYFAPGLTTWETGDNAGTSQEVESFTGGDSGADGYVSLRFTTRKAIQVGDTGKIRRDCTRKWTGHNSCETFFAALKGEHFNGEPNINIGDTTANSIPGVNTTVATGGTGE